MSPTLKQRFLGILHELGFGNLHREVAYTTGNAVLTQKVVHLAFCRGLVSYGFGNLHWAVAYVIASFASFLAGVLIYSYNAEKTDTSSKGLHAWLVSCCCACIESHLTLELFIQC